jgi:hypothetical protein
MYAKYFSNSFYFNFPLVLQAQTDSSFVGALTKGNISGQVRLMSISTWNKADLSDYSAGAVGLTWVIKPYLSRVFDWLFQGV